MSIYADIVNYKPEEERRRDAQYATARKVVQSFVNNGWDRDVDMFPNKKVTATLTKSDVSEAYVKITVEPGFTTQVDVVNQGSTRAGRLTDGPVSDELSELKELIASAMYDSGLTARLV